MSDTNPGLTINIHTHSETRISPLNEYQKSGDCERFVSVGIGYEISIFLHSPDTCRALITELEKAEAFLASPTPQQRELCDERATQ